MLIFFTHLSCLTVRKFVESATVVYYARQMTTALKGSKDLGDQLTRRNLMEPLKVRFVKEQNLF